MTEVLKPGPVCVDVEGLSLTGQAEGYTLVNYIDLFTSNLAKTNLWTPLINTLLMSVGACVIR